MSPAPPQPLRVTDPRVPLGGSIGPGGIILDANGNPVVGPNGKPIISDPRIPPGAADFEDGRFLSGVAALGAGDDDNEISCAAASGLPTASASSSSSSTSASLTTARAASL